MFAVEENERDYKCPQCRNTEAFDVDDLIEAGDPICPECDFEFMRPWEADDQQKSRYQAHREKTAHKGLADLPKQNWGELRPFVALYRAGVLPGASQGQKTCRELADAILTRGGVLDTEALAGLEECVQAVRERRMNRFEEALQCGDRPEDVAIQTLR